MGGKLGGRILQRSLQACGQMNLYNCMARKEHYFAFSTLELLQLKPFWHCLIIFANFLPLSNYIFKKIKYVLTKTVIRTILALCKIARKLMEAELSCF